MNQAKQIVKTLLEEEDDDPKRELFRMVTSTAYEDLDVFTRSYIECAFWSSMDESNEQGGEPLDRNYGPEDLTREALFKMQRDCKDFQRKYEHLFDGEYELAGHYFWLTRNHHGSGFWDGWSWSGEVEDALTDALTDAAHSYGEAHLTVNDDGTIGHYPA